MSGICPLFSGSSGNSTYIKDGKNGILVDVGASFKGLCDALSSIDESFENIRAVLITHEHDDHIKGLKTFIKKTGVPVYASEKTLDTLIKNDVIPSGSAVLPLLKAEEIGGFTVERFDTSHDCEGSSGYNVFLNDGRKITVCTDLGIVTDTVREHLSGSDVVLLESNHDIEMLRRGPYPPQLKLRILSDKGHLSNNACAMELPPLLKGGATRFILAHLSQHNNLPMLAKQSAKALLSEIGATENEDYILSIAKPSNNGVVHL